MNNSNGAWHESLASDGPASGSSDRSFGLVFAAVFGLLSVAAVWGHRPTALWWSLAALAFLLVALFAAPLLGPLNRAWTRLAVLISRVANPIILAIAFYGVLTPAGLIARLAGKDLLRLRFNATAPSYWLPRATPNNQTTMTKPF